MGEQRVVVGCPLHSRACLSACSELVRWRQCTKYVLQPVCGPLLPMLLLVHEPAEKESEIMTCKKLKWNRMLKTKKSINENYCLCFSSIRFWYLKFCLTVLPFLVSFPALFQPTHQPINIRQTHTSSASSQDLGGLHRNAFCMGKNSSHSSVWKLKFIHKSDKFHYGHHQMVSTRACADIWMTAWCVASSVEKLHYNAPTMHAQEWLLSWGSPLSVFRTGCNQGFQ